MRDIYERLGGHPYTIALFARHAGRGSPEAVLADLAGMHKELLDFTLLDRAAAALPDRARTLLCRAAIYDEPVPPEGLAWMLGDERDAMPPVADEVAALLVWGLLARPPGTEDYAAHALVRDWARAALAADERLGLLRRAAQFWIGVGRDSSSLVPELNARHYLFLAGDYQQADEIVQFAYKYLVRWGQIELVLRLLGESVRTLSGSRRATALGNLATVYEMLGDYQTARQYYEKVLAEFQTLDDRRNIAAVLHSLGMLHQHQGEYADAHQRYQQALAIAEELGDRAGVAQTLHQLGNLHSLQGEYEPARQRYQQSLAIKQELGDRDGMARTLHQLGRLFEEDGAETQAIQYVAQAFVIFYRLGSPDREIAPNTLTRLHQKMGEAAFNTALASANVPQASDNDAEQGMTREQALEVAVDNTIAVLISLPDQKSEWLDALGQLQSDAEAQDDADLAAFCGLLHEVVEGRRPAS